MTTLPELLADLEDEVADLRRLVAPLSPDAPEWDWATPADGWAVSYADLELDEETRDVWRQGKLVTLTVTEYKLLHYLLANARKVLTRDQILEQVWDYTFAGNASVLETYISYLRHKIDEIGPPLIHTVRGVGYSLRLPPDS